MGDVGTSPNIPMVELSQGGVTLPIIGFGMGPNPRVPDEVSRVAALEAIEVGYRHFDTAPIYLTEKGLGQAISDAIERGMIKSREHIFVTSKLWCSDAHPHLVIPAIKRSLEALQLEYLDLYMIHWPVSGKPKPPSYPLMEEDFLPFDFKGVWSAMEECKKLGLAKAIGVCNFTRKKLDQLLAIATIPPAVNQVEVNPKWQQKELIKYCKSKGILVIAHSPLGGPLEEHKLVMECDVLKEIAQTKGKSVAQIALRWGYEQGIAIVVSSYIKEWMIENLEIFDWELSSDEHDKIAKIPQRRTLTGWDYISPIGPYRTFEELWDGDI